MTAVKKVFKKDDGAADTEAAVHKGFSDDVVLKEKIAAETSYNVQT